MGESKFLLLYKMQVMADPVRQAFLIGGIPFEEKKVDDKEMKEQGWGSAQVLLSTGKDRLFQLSAILRYIGKLGKLYPTNDAKLAGKIDEICEMIREFRKAFGNVHDQDNADKTIVDMADELQEIIHNNGDKFVVGDRMTIADLEVCSLVRWLTSRPTVDQQEFLSTFALLAQTRDMVLKHPQVLAGIQYADGQASRTLSKMHSTKLDQGSPRNEAPRAPTNPHSPTSRTNPSHKSLTPQAVFPVGGEMTIPTTRLSGRASTQRDIKSHPSQRVSSPKINLDVMKSAAGLPKELLMRRSATKPPKLNRSMTADGYLGAPKEKPKKKLSRGKSALTEDRGGKRAATAKPGSPTGTKGAGSPSGTKSLGSPTSPTKTKGAGSPTGSKAEGSPTGSKAEGSPTGSRALGSPTGSRALGSPTGSRALGSPALKKKKKKDVQE